MHFKLINYSLLALAVKIQQLEKMFQIAKPKKLTRAKAFICNVVTWANVCVDILNISYSRMWKSCTSSLQQVCSIRKQHRRYSNLPMWYGLLSGTGNFNINLSEWWHMGRNSTSLLA